MYTFAGQRIYIVHIPDHHQKPDILEYHIPHRKGVLLVKLSHKII